MYVHRSFYETVAPLLLVGRASLLAISTLTSEYNFYTRLIKMFDVATGRPMFHSIQVQLACTACIEDGKTASCVHMLHLIPRWQSSERHTRLKTIMQDRPDLIESESSGLAFDSLQCCFRPGDIEVMYTQPGLPPVFNEPIYIVIDPAAGGPGSDYGIISFSRNKGLIQAPCVPVYATRYALRARCTSCCTLCASLRCQLGTMSWASAVKKPGALFPHSASILELGNPLHTQVLPT
ncbi:hypothetical protein T484DRAFT_1756758 [Baffinella frigidus]|nr:hypothetical protein T484DRAFT_1756758 [Cryptophyta sp. CCMP2293]